MTNTLIKDVLETFRLRKVKEEVKVEETLKTKGELYDLGGNFIKSIKDYEVMVYRNIDKRRR